MCPSSIYIVSLDGLHVLHKGLFSPPDTEDSDKKLKKLRKDLFQTLPVPFFECLLLDSIHSNRTE